MSFPEHRSQTQNGSVQIDRDVLSMDGNTLATTLDKLALADVRIPTVGSTTCTTRTTTVRPATAEHRIVDSFTARRRAFARAAFQQDSDFIARRMERKRQRAGAGVFITRAAEREIVRMRRESVVISRGFQATCEEDLQRDFDSMREAMTRVGMREIQQEVSMNGVWVSEDGERQARGWEAQGPDMEGLCGKLEEVRV